MTAGFGPRFALAALLCTALAATGGCTRVAGHQGYLVDETLVSAIQPGVDNRESVEKTLGRPSFVGQFDQRDWYYVSRGTKNLAFQMPNPNTQMTLHIRFDEAGNVVSVERTGLEKVASINPTDDETPTLGRDRGFLEEVFGNIGQVGSTGRSGNTTDNPN
jgi:outer membrane protein assembly factor BamE (lipoprotein component of BamABCDE complex)